MPLPIDGWPDMPDDECALCGCNGSACSGCHGAEEPPLTEAEIDEIEAIYREMKR